jgi:hypothetical protein
MATDQTSPLGRYDDGDPQRADEAAVEVVLLGVPVRIMAAAMEHHDGMMREFALLSLAQRDGDDEPQPEPHRDVPVRLVELVRVLGERYGRAASRPDQTIEAARERGERTMDLHYQVPAHVVEAADQLEAMMAEADEFARQEQLLTVPRSDILMQFSRWYLEEFRRQIAGGAPQRWTGPLDP